MGSGGLGGVGDRIFAKFGRHCQRFGCLLSSNPVVPIFVFILCHALNCGDPFFTFVGYLIFALPWVEPPHAV